MTEQELHDARTNDEFLLYLNEKEETALKQNNLKDLYEVLDSLLILDLDENRIHKVYERILRSAFDGIEERLKESKKLDIASDDLYFVRAFYEHAIEKWSYGNVQGAKELFFILVNIVDDKLISDACSVKMLACDENQDMETFYAKSVEHQDKARDERYGYFILDFTFDTQKYLDSNSEKAKKIYDELSHLLGV